MAGTLYIVATPIGNLEDITHRALRVLSEVDLIACEDTRHTRSLLSRYGIKTRTISYHEHNERARAAQLSAVLESGRTVALVSDAGTPLISDPGFRLVRAAHERGIPVVSIPGPTALVAAVVASGLPVDQFFFGGFLPPRSSARRARLEQLRMIPATLVFYEAPHRLARTLKDAYAMLGERDAVVVRELTKIHEEVARGHLSDLARRFASRASARGEIVLLIGGALAGDEPMLANATPSLAERVRALESQGLDAKAALKQAARELGLRRSEAYRRLVAERSTRHRDS